MLHFEMRAQTIPLAFGDAGTAQTIAAMRRLVEEGKKDPVVHETAAAILRRVRSFDWHAEARAIFDWVRQNIRFTRDVQGKETLHSAREILRLGIGDCDDYTVLICALLGTVGHRCRIVTIAGHGEDPSQFSHVYPEVFLNGQWIPLDAARRNPGFAQAPENFYRKRVWNTTSDEYIDVEGLGATGAQTTAALARAVRRRPLGQYHPARAPVAYRANVYPRFRRLRSTPFLGVGHYGKPATQQLGVDWSDIADVITAGGETTANIIAASRASPFNLFPTTGPGARVPYGAPVGPIGPSPFAGVSPTWLLIGGGLLIAVLMARR